LYVNANVAIATDGAAPKMPENVLGAQISPMTANAETITPPTKNLINNSRSNVLVSL
jgi:hypothetical protein